MSFHASATDIKVEDGHILKADLYDENGDKVEASLDLNTIIGNNDGHFYWEGENFRESASDISFDLEGDDGLPILRAVLGNAEGEGQDADINLAERITNNNGELVFQ